MQERSEGVVFVATGERYVGAARVAARSVRAAMPGVAVDLFSDVAGPIAEFDRVHPVPDAHHRSKVDCLAHSRFDATLYLDADTRVVADVRGLFRLMDRFDVALAHAHARNRRQTTATWRIDLPEPFAQLNTGVMVYRRTPAVLDLLAAWGAAYRQAGFRKDQVAMRELLWSSGLRLYVLPPEYNVRYRKYLALWEREEAAPKILHMPDFGQVLDPEAAVDPRSVLRPRPADALLRLWKRLDRRLDRGAHSGSSS